jgi:hypothetical protein
MIFYVKWKRINLTSVTLYSFLLTEATPWTVSLSQINLFLVQFNYHPLSHPIYTQYNWNKLLLTVWDQWQFRNSIAHSDEGPISIALHRQLNTRISEEFQQGYAEISADERYLFTSYTYLTLQEKKREYKQQWLASVQAARTVTNNSNATTPYLAAMRQFILDWLI